MQLNYFRDKNKYWSQIFGGTNFVCFVGKFWNVETPHQKSKL